MKDKYKCRLCKEEFHICYETEEQLEEMEFCPACNNDDIIRV